jgi:biotin-(acetyl-CoA carboxylase) ligase
MSTKAESQVLVSPRAAWGTRLLSVQAFSRGLANRISGRQAVQRLEQKPLPRRFVMGKCDVTEAGSSMSLKHRTRIQAPGSQDLVVPPPFRLVRLPEGGDAFGHAGANAAELGAGTLVFVGRCDVAEFAVVLETDERLTAARLAFCAGMVALYDAIASLAPPQKPIAIEWPDAIRVDGAVVGGGRLAWPAGLDEYAAPEWLVFGAVIRIAAVGESEPGVDPPPTTLEAEGFDIPRPERVVEKFARHLLAADDRLREIGFAAVAKAYVSRLARQRGVRHDIAENGDLVTLQKGGPAERRALAPMLATPQWIDAQCGRPRI